MYNDDTQFLPLSDPIRYAAPENVQASAYNTMLTPRPTFTAVNSGEYQTLDSGVREPYASGMVRDSQEDKPRFDLLRPKGVPFMQQFFTRVALLMTRGAKKYGYRNWELANSQEELERFEASAERHMHQYLAGDRTEDHAAAVVFNLLAAETIRWKIANLR